MTETKGTDLKFTLLGCGSSGGVPRIGNQWGACDPSNPKNRRRRCALLIEKKSTDGGITSVLIDTGADMREQMLSAKVKNLDAVMLTHSHADHIFGLDDLRQLAISTRASIDVYMDQATSQIVMSAFGYCFKQAPGSSYPAFCIEHRIKAADPVTIRGAGGEIQLLPFSVEHGDIDALGYRCEDLVYLPDVKTITRSASRDAMIDAKVLVLDALRRSPHPSHLNLDEAISTIRHYSPSLAILTNMHADMDYQTLRDSLPKGILPGYDGMTIELGERE